MPEHDNIPPSGEKSVNMPGVLDVAELAQVSTGTTSNVINHPEKVSAQARTRVESAIEKLGYVRNHSAQVLRSGVSSLVGVTVPDISNPFFIGASVGMEQRLAEDGCLMLLTSSHGVIKEEHRILRTFEAQGVRGVLIRPQDASYQQAKQLAARGIRIVAFDPPVAPDIFSSVAVDNFAGATLAVEHLAQLGHKKYAFLSGPRAIPVTRDRLTGFNEAVKAIPDATSHIVELPEFTSPAGYEGIMRLHSATADFPTALFCANDLIAIGAMRALLELGKNVPDDVSIVGFDDIPLSGQLSVPLTTVHQPMADLGRKAADLLLDPSESICHVELRPQLVIRASSATAPRPAKRF